TYIKLGSPPFTGSFIPEGSLGAVNNGQNADGVWSLCVFDRRAMGNTGSLLNWSITFSNAPAPPPPVMPSKCAINLPVGGTCTGSPLICSFDAACGRTDGIKQSWVGLEPPFSCFG